MSCVWFRSLTSHHHRHYLSPWPPRPTISCGGDSADHYCCHKKISSCLSVPSDGLSRKRWAMALTYRSMDSWIDDDGPQTYRRTDGQWPFEGGSSRVLVTIRPSRRSFGFCVWEIFLAFSKPRGVVAAGETLHTVRNCDCGVVIVQFKNYHSGKSKKLIGYCCRWSMFVHYQSYTVDQSVSLFCW